MRLIRLPAVWDVFVQTESIESTTNEQSIESGSNPLKQRRGRVEPLAIGPEPDGIGRWVDHKVTCLAIAFFFFQESKQLTLAGSLIILSNNDPFK